jgi:hypothetical protein
VSGETVFAGGLDAGTQAFDLYGRPISEPLAGRPVAMDDRYLALETTDSSAWAVYRVR